MIYFVGTKLSNLGCTVNKYTAFAVCVSNYCQMPILTCFNEFPFYFMLLTVLLKSDKKSQDVGCRYVWFLFPSIDFTKRHYDLRITQLTQHPLFKTALYNFKKELCNKRYSILLAVLSMSKT